MNRSCPSPRLCATREQEQDQDILDLSPLGFEIAISRGNDENDESGDCPCTSACAPMEEGVDVSSSSNCCLEEDLAAPLPSRKDLGYDDDEEEPGAVSSVHSALSALSVGKPVRNKRSSIRRSICSSTRRSTCSNSTASNCSSIYTALSAGRPIRNKRSSIVSSTNLRRSMHAAIGHPESTDEDDYARHKALIALKFSKQNRGRQQEQDDAEEEEDIKAVSRSSVISALSSSGSGCEDEDFSIDSFSRRRTSRICRQSFRHPCARLTARRSSNSADSLQAALAAARAVVVNEED